MLALIPGWKLQEWKTFEELDPPHEERMEYGLAHIVQAMLRDGRPLREFLLSFGDYVKPAPVQQSVAYQEMIIDSWCTINNAIVERKGGTR